MLDYFKYLESIILHICGLADNKEVRAPPEARVKVPIDQKRFMVTDKIKPHEVGSCMERQVK